MWNIRKIVSKGQYNYAVVPEHPKAIVRGYVLEHRVIVENNLGRILTEDEIVHHIDGNKKNNNLCNLEVMSKLEHKKHHGKDKQRKISTYVCPTCKQEFTRFSNLSFYSKQKFCSRSCNGKYQRQQQLLGEQNVL